MVQDKLTKEQRYEDYKVALVTAVGVADGLSGDTFDYVAKNLCQVDDLLGFVVNLPGFDEDRSETWGEGNVVLIGGFPLTALQKDKHDPEVLRIIGAVRAAEKWGDDLIPGDAAEFVSVFQREYGMELGRRIGKERTRALGLYLNYRAKDYRISG